jgi:hypothetical protein
MAAEHVLLVEDELLSAIRLVLLERRAPDAAETMTMP